MALLKRIIAVLLVAQSINVSSQPLRVGVAGLTHDHAHGIMNQYRNGEVIITGIVEQDVKLIERYKKNYQLHDSLFYKTLEALIDKTKPEVVLAYNAISEHLSVVEVCAPRKISVM